jgi:hypothetical protein
MKDFFYSNFAKQLRDTKECSVLPVDYVLRHS